MLEALSAEALKMRRHKATWFLVWLFPIVFAIIFVVAIVLGLADLDQQSGQQSLNEWIEDTAIIWFVPGNALGRYLIAAFVAVVFAGEYGWNTWKLIVPHRSRNALIAAKYALILCLFAVSFLLTALISIAGTFAEDAATGDALPAGLSASLMLEYHAKAALAALAPAMLTIAYASLAAVLTRSMIAALLIAIVATTLEQLLFNFAPILSVRFPGIIQALYPVLPGYHLANLNEFIREGAGLRVEFPNGRIVAYSWATSLAAAAAWIGALVALTFGSFRRQDIN
jgi:uncharacterized membrane protein